MHAVFCTILRVGTAVHPQEVSPPCHAVSGCTTQPSQAQDQTIACLLPLLQHVHCEDSMVKVPFNVIGAFGACIASKALCTRRPRLPSWQRAAQVPRRAAAHRRGRWRTCASACTARFTSPQLQSCRIIRGLPCKKYDLPEACRLAVRSILPCSACMLHPAIDGL